jgi:hypothetical protein
MAECSRCGVVLAETDERAWSLRGVEHRALEGCIAGLILTLRAAEAQVDHLTLERGALTRLLEDERATLARIYAALGG